jgi:hypothetical protein
MKSSHQIWAKIPGALAEDGGQATGWTNNTSALPLEGGKGMAKMAPDVLREFVRDLVDGKIVVRLLGEERNAVFF